MPVPAHSSQNFLRNANRLWTRPVPPQIGQSVFMVLILTDIPLNVVTKLQPGSPVGSQRFIRILLTSRHPGQLLVVRHARPYLVHPPAVPIRSPAEGRRLAARTQMGGLQISGHQGRRRRLFLLEEQGRIYGPIAKDGRGLRQAIREIGNPGRGIGADRSSRRPPTFTSSCARCARERRTRRS